MDRTPALPVAVEPDTNRFEVDPRSGEKFIAVNRTFTPYDLGRIREGYCCLVCGEAQFAPDGLPVAFPERCVCGFPMRAEQTAKFAEEFDGEVTVGPSRSIEEVRAIDDERRAKERESRIWVPS